MTAKSNAWRHDIQRLYFKLLNVTLGKNFRIDLGKFVEQAPVHYLQYPKNENAEYTECKKYTPCTYMYM